MDFNTCIGQFANLQMVLILEDGHLDMDFDISYNFYNHSSKIHPLADMCKYLPTRNLT